MKKFIKGKAAGLAGRASEKLAGANANNELGNIEKKVSNAEQAAQAAVAGNADKQEDGQDDGPYFCLDETTFCKYEDGEGKADKTKRKQNACASATESKCYWKAGFDDEEEEKEKEKEKDKGEEKGEEKGEAKGEAKGEEKGEE